MYVLRSYCDAGNSRLPGSEDDMAGIGRLEGLTMRAKKGSLD